MKLFTQCVVFLLAVGVLAPQSAEANAAALAGIAKALQKTNKSAHKVSLSSLTFKGKTIQIQGVAKSFDAVATFLKQLSIASGLVSTRLQRSQKTGNGVTFLMVSTTS